MASSAPEMRHSVAGHSRTDDVAAPYCCPTPPVSPKGCRSGPVAQQLGIGKPRGVDHHNPWLKHWDSTIRHLQLQNNGLNMVKLGFVRLFIMIDP